jgi:hypothetical protein
MKLIVYTPFKPNKIKKKTKYDIAQENWERKLKDLGFIDPSKIPRDELRCAEDHHMEI